MNTLTHELSETINQITNEIQACVQELNKPDSYRQETYDLAWIKALKHSNKVLKEVWSVTISTDLDERILQEWYDRDFIPGLLKMSLITNYSAANATKSLKKIKLKGKADGYLHVISILENVKEET